MSNQSSLEKPAAASRAVEWTLGHFSRLPVEKKTTVILGLLGAVTAIGWADYITGIQMSFVVFYVVPVGFAVITLGRTGGAIVACASVGIRFLADSTGYADGWLATWLWWNSAGSLLVYLAIVWMLDALSNFQKQLEYRVQARTAELEQEVQKRQAAQRDLLELSANERASMGHELHDQLGQHLVGTALAAQVLAHKLNTRDPAAGREARQIADLVEQGIAQTRQLAHGMMMTSVEPNRFDTELDELCATLKQQYPRVHCHRQVEVSPLLRDPMMTAQLFRIAQEALRNAMRHSRATDVWLSVEDLRPGLRLSVEDNGRGLPPPSERHGMGLRIMQHRAERLGTEFSITERKGGGTCVTCTVSQGNLGSFSHAKHEDTDFSR